MESKIAVVYSSCGGNTRMVAEALRGALAEAGREVRLAEVTVADDAAAREAVGAADTVLLGFWCNKGTCSDEVSALMSELADKRVFLFGTAGFGGAPEYFERILAGVREKLPADAAYLGGAMCQGKMGPGIRKRYEAMLAEKPGDARIQSMIDNFDAALAHPDEADLADIVAAAKEALSIR
ncbi:hypothetical protein H6A35_02295 [Collinsella tanakaei]|nr:hypothetical protein [Collinsella tanakaei]